MPYNYSNGDGPSVLIITEPANSDSIKFTCAQSIRQIKAFINDPVAGFVWLRNYVNSLASTVGNHESRISSIEASIGGTAAASGQFIFHAEPAVDQDTVLPVGDLDYDVVLGHEVFDPDAAFNEGTGLFTAPSSGFYEFHCSIRCEVVSGAPTVVNMAGGILGSGLQLIPTNTVKNIMTGSNASIVTASGIVYLDAGTTVKLVMHVHTDAVCTLRTSRDFTDFYGMRVR